MDGYGYEIKLGKHITFRFKNQQKRATRGKTIGEDYTESRIRKRIEAEVSFKSRRPKQPFKGVENVIDIDSNAKIKSSPGYEFWATKHNIHAMADTLTMAHKSGYTSRADIEKALIESSSKVQDLLTENKILEKQIAKKMKAMENLQIIKQYRQIYKYAMIHPKDKAFLEEYKPQLAMYKTAVNESFKGLNKLPSSKSLLEDIEKLSEKRKEKLAELNSVRDKKDSLYQYKKNYDTYLGKEVER